MYAPYTGKHRITYYDLDYRARLKLSALLRMVHVAADADAVALGIGFSAMVRRHMSFLLQRFSLQADRWPGYGEEVTIRTWPHSIKAGAFLRKGQMMDADGSVIIEWISMWILFCTKNRTILRPAALEVDMPQVQQPGVDFAPKKIAAPADWAGARSQTHQVRYADVDTNMHTNNSIYGDIIANALFCDMAAGDAAAPTDAAISQLHINYLAETVFGQNIQVACLQGDGGVFVRGVADGRVSFLAQMQQKMPL